MASDSEKELIGAWRSLDVSQPPYILPGDELLREKCRGRDLFVSYSSNEEFLADPEYGRIPDTLLHIGLLPEPYIGNLANAKVFVLTGNPSWGDHNYYSEYGVPAFRAAKIRNLRQENESEAYPNVYLNPRYGWHGGSDYWRKKFFANCRSNCH